MPRGLPAAQGLYDPRNEHDNCGVGFICQLKGKKSHDIVENALKMVRNMDHRGGCGCDPQTGDGAGIFLQLPTKFFRKVAPACGISLPEEGRYAVAMVYLPRDEAERAQIEAIYEQYVREEGQQVLGWRTVPVMGDTLGVASKESEPVMRQLFIGRSEELGTVLDFERKLYVIRSCVDHAVKALDLSEGSFYYTASLSSRTILYKGMLTTEQLDHYFPDLHDEALESAMAMVHSRFSTNTFPSWPRGQPFRYMSHNGEINTVRGNANWMHARQGLLGTGVLGKDIEKILPIIDEAGSDSAMFDNCVEFLVLSGRPLHHAVMMMIPEPWERHQHMSKEKKDFYEYHACMMEPWDGPASIAFSDGVSIGAVLDRNGLRPSRFYVTSDDLVIMASEVGVIPVEPSTVIRKGRLQPGRMFLVDTSKGRIVPDAEIKAEIAAEKPYGEWLAANRIFFNDLPAAKEHPSVAAEELIGYQRAFGYTYEDKRMILGPTAESGAQPLGSMGNDTPLAVFSQRPVLLYNYFRQLFAQVTNPPIDPIREELITSSISFVGSEGDLINPGPSNCRMIRLESPIVENDELERLRELDLSGFKSAVLPILYTPGEDGSVLEAALDGLFAAADSTIAEGANLLILSDRGLSADKAPIPALLAVAGLHHHLIRTGTRTKVSIILESGEPREVMHFALLLGYGANVINAYMAEETIREMCANGEISHPADKAVHNFVKGSVKGVIKTMAKMGISTVASYRGAQIFEAIGLKKSVIDKYFTWTASRVEGIGLDEISAESAYRHARAWKPIEVENDALETGGVFQWRSDGEAHLFNPQTIHLLQKATRLGSMEVFREYSRLIDDQSQRLCTMRGLMEFNFDESSAIPVEEVESVDAIIRRFKTGAMSFGSISKEAHETLAIAMNRIGGRSNTGEGGEDPERFIPLPNGDSKRSAIKQVASGRFGVTSNYLVNSDEIQIKMAQGAKPGEGGELPGHKVYPPIAKVRGTTPGVGLISPPPHHDIYSIEDLAELIHDLKNANEKARISVKLVSEVGVGTIAAGVAKAKADTILISGHDGGTGASPTSSIYHAGSPWELGIAETNQTLLMNDLRSRVYLEVDGQLKTGRDVAIACLLGGEEFGFATAPLVSLGCLMMRVCHKNTCPVGVATQNPELRAKFRGAADYVVNFMRFIAQELRETMAKLGFRSIDEMVGRCDKLRVNKAIDFWKVRGLDYSKILYRPQVPANVGTFRQISQEHLLELSLDKTALLDLCKPALERGERVRAELPIVNTNRVVGTLTGSELTRRYGADGLPEGTIHLKFKGSAGQSLGAFCPKGMTFEVEGDTNDYVGKGLSGATIVVYPHRDGHPSFVAEDNIITGNVAFYGATAGEAFISGIAGERFCVRNSGVHAVVEGVGDHACEYMTGGSVICLGRTGRNFAAGMSGGIAYVFDVDGDFVGKVNAEMVNIYRLVECEDSEIAAVKARIEKHAALTGSKLAGRILEGWQQNLGKMVKIMPQDYERMLNAMKQAEASGLKGEEAVLKAFEENTKAAH
ncbi:MAG: glutamate synthase large subunit [Opitutales bacterium]|nr:glutamate synthase large subunit [Opitutales bacterium]